MIRLLFFVLCSIITILNAKETYNSFETNPFITAEERTELGDFLIPSEHPIKPLLDSIFLSSRATSDRASLQKAGFKIIKDQPRSYIIVAKHPTIPGFLFKIYLDSDTRLKKQLPGWQWYKNRIKGIKDIEKCIADNKFTIFKTPEKWVYPLPMVPAPNPFYDRKNFVLVVQDMDILSDKENLEHWKTLITEKHLDDLKVVFETCGGSSIRPRNLPFTRDGKIAFIDTEYPHHIPVYKQCNKFLSKKMLAYWKKITSTPDGKK